jgi:hypothetical protein
MMSRSKRRVPLTPWSLGSIPVTSIEVEQAQQAVDPAVEKAAKLKTRAQEIIAQNEQRKRDAEAKRLAGQARIADLKTRCTATEFAAIEECVRVNMLSADNPAGWTPEQVESGDAHQHVFERFCD